MQCSGSEPAALRRAKAFWGPGETDGCGQGAAPRGIPAIEHGHAPAYLR